MHRCEYEYKTIDTGEACPYPDMTSKELYMIEAFEKEVKTSMNFAVKIFLVVGVLMILSTCIGCAEPIVKAPKIKKLEYRFNGSTEWQSCFIYETKACGPSFKCGDEIRECTINYEVRST